MCELVKWSRWRRSAGLSVHELDCCARRNCVLHRLRLFSAPRECPIARMTSSFSTVGTPLIMEVICFRADGEQASSLSKEILASVWVSHIGREVGARKRSDVNSVTLRLSAGRCL